MGYLTAIWDLRVKNKGLNSWSALNSEYKSWLKNVADALN
jgi:hypothetical protein